MADAHSNFATSLVATAPSPATSGTSLVVTGGEGSRFPTVPFNATVAPASAAATPANAEIVRVTGISTDTFTITRATESSSARTVVVGDRIFAGVTKKTLTDIETVDAAAGTGSLRTLGTSATSAAAGNDSRLSDIRDPTLTAHTWSGAQTFTGGVVGGGLTNWWTFAPINASTGSEVGTVAGTNYYVGIFIPVNCTLTGIGPLIGPTASGTGKIIVNLYNSAGTDVAHSNLAGTTVPTASRYQLVPFTGTYNAAGPALYFAAAMLDGTGTRLRHINPTDVTVSGYLGARTGSTTGTFGTIPTITPPTGPTSGIGPVLVTY